MCFHSADVLRQGGGGDNMQLNFKVEKDRDYDINYLYNRWTIPTASIFFRAKFKNSIIRIPGYFGQDKLMRLSLAYVGKVRGMASVMSVYRRHDGGFTSQPERMWKNGFEIWEKSDALLRKTFGITCARDALKQQKVEYIVYLLKKRQIKKILTFLPKLELRELLFLISSFFRIAIHKIFKFSDFRK
jgi:hypothetical protein